MTPEEFTKLYQQEPPPFPRHLWDIGMEYHRTCEAYDRTVCSHINERGIAMPIDGREFQLINVNAHMVKKDLLRRYSVAPQELSRAIRDTAYDFEREVAGK